MFSKKRTKFLVIDGSRNVCEMVTMEIKKFGFQLVTAVSNGMEAMRILEMEVFDFVICEWNLAEQNGLDILKYIRSEEKHKKTRFMMMTSDRRVEIVKMAIDAGVNEFVVKPFVKGVLPEKLKQMILRPVRVPKEHLQNSTERLSQASVDGEVPVLEPESTPETALHKKNTILVVDDVPTNIDVIAGLLKDDYKVKVATNGEKALKIANSDTQPDLILLDVMMPEMDGMEVCKRLKLNPETAYIPVIFLTAKADSKDVADGFNVGAVDYVSKPVNATVLKARIENHLALKHSIDAAREQADDLLMAAQFREEMERVGYQAIGEPASEIMAVSDNILNGNWMNAEQKSEIHKIYNASQKILETIGQSLALHDIEAGVYRSNPVKLDVSKIVEDVVTSSRHSASQKDVTLVLEQSDGLSVVAEEGLVSAAIQNILRNAVEASHKGEVVSVKLSVKDEDVAIEIHNERAVPEEIRESFFDKFSTAGKDGAHGIGAYATLRIVQQFGGDVTMKTDSSTGTVVTISFPISLF